MPCKVGASQLLVVVRPCSKFCSAVPDGCGKAGANSRVTWHVSYGMGMPCCKVPCAHVPCDAAFAPEPRRNTAIPCNVPQPPWHGGCHIPQP